MYVIKFSLVGLVFIFIMLGCFLVKKDSKTQLHIFEDICFTIGLFLLLLVGFDLFPIALGLSMFKKYIYNHTVLDGLLNISMTIVSWTCFYITALIRKILK